VFPASTVGSDPAVPPYRLLGPAQVNHDCRVGATGSLGRLLLTSGCNEVVRATVVSPDRGYVITVGVFNLVDRDVVSTTYDQVDALIKAKSGRFTGYITSNGFTKVLGRAEPASSWLSVAHFLAYCVIVRVDGKPVINGDPNVRIIVYDLLESYLRDRVLAAWAVDHSTPGPSAAAAPS
jgi:hypothetical protein